jgi:hypothetical protein
MEIKIILSIPNTISRAVKAANASQASALKNHSNILLTFGA